MKSLKAALKEKYGKGPQDIILAGADLASQIIRDALEPNLQVLEHRLEEL